MSIRIVLLLVTGAIAAQALPCLALAQAPDVRHGVPDLQLQPAPLKAEAEHSAAASEEESAGGGLLGVQKDLAIWTAVVFLLLLAVLWRFAWGPISEGLLKREKLISDQIAEAEQTNRQAKDLLAEYEQRLARSQDEVRAILDQARRDADQAGRSLIEKARAEAKREEEKAVREIDAAAAGAMKELAEALGGTGRDAGGQDRPCPPHARGACRFDPRGRGQFGPQRAWPYEVGQASSLSP